MQPLKKLRIHLESRYKDKLVLDSNEILIKQGAANLFRKFGAVGGWLYLTNKRIFFKPHRFNVRAKEASIPIMSIKEVQPTRSLWLFPNRIVIRTDSKTFSFILNERDVWTK